MYALTSTDFRTPAKSPHGQQVFLYNQHGEKRREDMTTRELLQLLNSAAPDFTLPDVDGRAISLSDFAGRKNVLLVFNRGFL